MKRPNPAEEAKEVLRLYGITSAPVPVEAIAKHMGVDVRYAALDDELSGMIFIKDGRPIIGINRLHHPNRQRFTIAHELGHFVMHKKLITNEVHVDRQFRVLMRDGNAGSGTQKEEVEANRFAAALLMPEALVLKAIADHTFDIDDENPLSELAKQFKVSRQTMEYRVRNLA